MTIFDFDKVSVDRISNIIKSSIMSLKDCADILEKTVPLCTMLTKERFMDLISFYTENLTEVSKLSEEMPEQWNTVDI